MKKNFHNLIVNNKVLSWALSSEKNKFHFTNYIMKFECVVFCRTNPNQKVEIVRLLKKKKKRTLAIGDGANDVNMI